MFLISMQMTESCLLHKSCVKFNQKLARDIQFCYQAMAMSRLLCCQTTTQFGDTFLKKVMSLLATWKSNSESEVVYLE